jgi:RimJ/RimL family protein N-acetyltransferase
VKAVNFLKKLDGDRCYLAPVNPEDTIYVAKWSNELEIAVNTGDAPDMISYGRQREYLEHMNLGGYGFLIIVKENDKPIGICRLMSVDMINKRATLGVFIGKKDYLSKGLWTEKRRIKILGFNKTLKVN